MVRVLFSFLLFILSGQLVAGQDLVSEEKTDILVSKFEIEKIPEELADLVKAHINDLAEQKEKYSEKKFLKILFRSTQKLFLRNFEPHITFSALAEGHFDCVTGSSLFAIILSALDVPFEIQELENHVYILVNTTKGQALLESTDPYFGLVFGERHIEERQDSYKEMQSDPDELPTEAVLINQHPTIENSITLHQLAGLHAYNQATMAFNSGDFTKCYQLLLLSERFYPCARVSGLMKVVMENLPVEISMR